ncbi:hypothetical protein GGI35DRAFT_346500 [Trichoderma velutinum]
MHFSTEIARRRWVIPLVALTHLIYGDQCIEIVLGSKWEYQLFYISQLHCSRGKLNHALQTWSSKRKKGKKVNAGKDCCSSQPFSPYMQSIYLA